MEIKRAGSQPSTKGPSDWFTGTVRIDPLFQAPDPVFVQGASVTFEPGARTAWHRFRCVPRSIRVFVSFLSGNCQTSWIRSPPPG